MTIPQDFLTALPALPKTEAFFRMLDRKSLYPIHYRLQTAIRPETRARRMEQLLEQLGRGECFHLMTHSRPFAAKLPLPEIIRSFTS